MAATVFAGPEGKSVIDVQFTKTALEIPVAAEVKMRTPGGEIQITGMRLTPGSGDQGTRLSIPLLPPGLREADFILTPNPGAAEDAIGFERIWGEEILFRNVPLKREDLETSGS